MWDAEDQVGGDVVETRLAGAAEGLCGLCGGVAAVHQAQAAVVERLDADRQSVDPRPPQGLEVDGVEVVGVRLEGRLIRFRTVEKRRGVLQQAGDGLRGAERRGSAAEIACPHRLSGEVAAPGLQLAVQGPDQVVHAAQVGTAVEVAVGADALAEGDMEVDSCHFRGKTVIKDTKKV